MEIYFATSNDNKFKEAEEILSGKNDIKLERYLFEYNEIRSDNPKEIAKDAVIEAYRRLNKPVFVEDTGLFIESLNGFPGTYSGWVLSKIGIQGILNLMVSKKEDERNAEFKSVIAYKYNNENPIEFFEGICKGKIAHNITKNKKHGFGYDPIFIPNEGNGKTFSESIQLKNKLSHRYKTLQKFSEFLEKQKF